MGRTDRAEYEGMPYGITNDLTAAARPGTIDILNGGVVAAGNLGVPIMDYAEVCFILSEANGWDQTWYETAWKHHLNVGVKKATK